MAYSTVTITGVSRNPAGKPDRRPFTFLPNVDRITDATGNVVMHGAETVTPDDTGTFTVVLPATDDVRLTPSGFQYHAFGPGGVDFAFSLPATPSAVDFADLVPIAPAPVPVANLQDATVAALLDNPSSGVATRVAAKIATAVAPAQAKADAAVPDVTTGLASFLYGNSYSVMTGVGWFTGGGHYAQKVAARLAGGAVTSYGVSGKRIIDVLGTLINGVAIPGCNGVIAAGKWPGVSARTGLVILESFINDMAHYPNMTAPIAIPAAVTTAYRNAMKVAYRAALAIISSESRVEAASATVAGTWTRGSAAAYASGGLVDFTTANAATATYTVTPPQTGPLAGKVYLLGYTLDPSAGTMAAQEIRVDGVLQTSRTPAPWEQYVGNTGGNQNVGVDVVEVVLPIDNAAHAIELKHVGAAGQILYNDAVLIPSTDPNPIAVMGAEHTIVGTPTWTAAQTAVYTANNRLMAPDLKGVVAEFPHAFYVPSTMTTNGVYSGDGLHPNDRGMQQRANDLLNAIRLNLPAKLANKVLAAQPNSNFAIV